MAIMKWSTAPIRNLFIFFDSPNAVLLFFDAAKVRIVADHAMFLGYSVLKCDERMFFYNKESAIAAQAPASVRACHAISSGAKCSNKTNKISRRKSAI